MRFSYKWFSIIVIAFVVIFSIVAIPLVSSLRFDYDFEAFFPNEDRELNFYEDYRNHFEYDNEFVLLGIENPNGIFDSVFLKKVDQLSTELKIIPDVKRVISPTSLKELILGGISPVEIPYLHFQQPDLYADDSLKIYRSDMVGSFFSTDAKSLCIYVKTEDRLSKKRSDTLARRIERTFSKFQFHDVHFVGRIVAQDVYLKMLNKEFIVFLSLSFILVIAFLYLTFRSFFGVIIPVSIVIISIYWTMAIMGILGKPIDIMTVMLPTMIFIAGMSDVVHFFTKYFEEVNKGTPRGETFRLILKEVGFPTFLTLITTVVGFLSLLFSSIKPIRDFGIFTSVGIIIAFILSYTMLPAILYFYTPKKSLQLHHQNSPTYGRMRKILFWIFRHPKWILLITGVIMALSVFGITKIRVNNILLEDLTNKHKIKTDFQFFDEHYSGVRPLEIALTIKDSSYKVWDERVLIQFEKVDSFLKKEYDAGFLISPAVIAKNINKALNNGDIAAYKLPGESEDFREIKKYIKQNRKNPDITRVIDTDGRAGRITGKIKDVGSLKVKHWNEQLEKFYKSKLDTALFSYRITGAATLLDRNNEYMVENMIQGFAWSIIIIAILTFLLHRSWRMVIVFILPNFIPMVIIAGFMGFAGIELKAATSLVFSIAFGIATDDTIHFISRFKIELEYGKSLLYAFKRTYFETGKPIILTTFILIGGFMSLMISDFTSTFLFGFLICITIVVALIAEMFLLPVLILIILGKKKEK